MQNKIPKPARLVILSLTVGIVTGSMATLSLTAFAQEDLVPDWFRGVAGFWAEGKISTAEFLDAIEFLIIEGLITVPGYGPTAEAEISSTDLSDVWAAIDNLQNQIDNIELTPGPPGPAGKDGSIPKVYQKVYHENPGIELDLLCDDGDVAIGTSFPTTKKVFLARPYPMNNNPDKNDESPYGWHYEFGTLDEGKIFISVICLDTSPDPIPTSSKSIVTPIAPKP